METFEQDSSILVEDTEPPSSFEIVLRDTPLSTPKSGIKLFKKEFYNNVLDTQWKDWKWQLRNCIVSQDDIQKIIGHKSLEVNNLNLPLRITPYYASLLWNKGLDYPLTKSVVPSKQELDIYPEEEEDPLSEESNQMAKGLIHRYPDRALLLVTNMCATYCRYCTRSRVVGKEGCSGINWDDIEKSLTYISNHPQIRDVIVSGGDPLLLDDDVLDRILNRIRSIKHVEIIRIGTKIPVVLPQRITSDLVKVLKKYHPLWMSIHFTHPDEITEDVKKACEKLANAGIPLGSQTVLLKNINDDSLVMKSLMQKLMNIRVKPYYLYQCDLVSGSRHFRTDVNKGLDIIRNIRGFTSGYAVPTYVIDAPGGGGKIPLLPEYFIKEEKGEITLKNYINNFYTYTNIKENCND